MNLKDNQYHLVCVALEDFLNTLSSYSERRGIPLVPIWMPIIGEKNMNSQICLKKNKFRRPMILVSETLVQSMSCPFRKQDLRLWNNFGPIFLICFEFRRRITCVKDIKVYIFTIFHKGHLHLDSLVLTKSVMDFSKKHLTYTFLFRFSLL